ncbi:MAG TPA: aldehyde dehydrogenase family protein [Acidimicrobiales bacterium]|nr:aldehyde dehydrogenase family protein [Acidimicrobiales bacterium]
MSIPKTAESPSLSGDPGRAIDRLRATYRSGATRTLSWRRTQLARLRHLVTAGESRLTAALSTDLGKPAHEGWLTELAFVTSEIDHAMRHLARWMRDERVRVPLVLQPDRARVRREPLGVVLVVAPWNYPVQLSLAPLVGALAAGNCVVVKPSEFAPATSGALAALAAEHLDEGAVTVLEGGPEVVGAALEAGVDHVFFTGSETTGRLVLQAAARSLTPVTLELGGKNPAIVVADAELGVAARRIAWGRFLNAGQTCVSTDYVLVERAVEERFLAALRTAIGEFYGSDPRSSPDYGRIVNDRHFARLADLLATHGGEVVLGGTTDRATRFIAPTVVRDPSWDSPLMAEETFGPILAVVGVEDLEDALARVTARPDPVALYVFSASRRTVRAVLERTRSGGVAVNGTVRQIAVAELPFGGIGRSGMGVYHGRAGFERLSQPRAVLVSPRRFDLGVVYPPYRPAKTRLLRLAQRWTKPAR